MATYARVSCNGKIEALNIASKLTTVTEFKKKLETLFSIPHSRQRLFFGGRELEDFCCLYDYNIRPNNLVHLVERVIINQDGLVPANDKEAKPKYIDAASTFFKVGDQVDAKDIVYGAWFEACIKRIVYNPASKNSKKSKCNSKNEVLTNSSSSDIDDNISDFDEEPTFIPLFPFYVKVNLDKKVAQTTTSEESHFPLFKNIEAKCEEKINIYAKCQNNIVINPSNSILNSKKEVLTNSSLSDIDDDISDFEEEPTFIPLFPFNDYVKVNLDKKVAQTTTSEKSHFPLFEHIKTKCEEKINIAAKCQNNIVINPSNSILNSKNEVLTNSSLPDIDDDISDFKEEPTFIPLFPFYVKVNLDKKEAETSISSEKKYFPLFKNVRVKSEDKKNSVSKSQNIIPNRSPRDKKSEKSQNQAKSSYFDRGASSSVNKHVAATSVSGTSKSDLTGITDNKLLKYEDSMNETDASKGSFEAHDDGLLYIVSFKSYPDEDTLELQLPQVRCRARTVIPISELEKGMIVMVNYNMGAPTEKGYWYDMKVSTVKSNRVNSEITGTLYYGTDGGTLDDCRILNLSEVFKIEQKLPLSSQTSDYRKLMSKDTEIRKVALVCLKCRDVEGVPCKHCGCSVCASKDKPGDILLCDECDTGYHYQCLTPPLTEVPDDDYWYCPSCKTDVHEIVKNGSRQQKKKKKSTNDRDWGRGMACAGRTKVSTIVPLDFFGPIPGVPVGTVWKYRTQASEAGVHRPLVSGIHGQSAKGAFSLCLAAGYDDDKDSGFEFTYTGSGGRDLSGNKRTSIQTTDQTLTAVNMALARNCNIPFCKSGGTAINWQDGKPVRVLRSAKLSRHNPTYAPKNGLRYDGIYKVVKYWHEIGKSGFTVWRYKMRRDDPNPAPWEEGGLEYPIVFPENYQVKEVPVKKGKKRPLEDLSSKANNKRAKKQKIDLPTKKELIIPHYILTDEQTKLINADTRNSKVWAECIAFLHLGEKKFVESIQENFLCAICQEICISPITTPCLHNICQACLKRSFNTAVSTCPNCRSDLDKKSLRTINTELSDALIAILPGYNLR